MRKINVDGSRGFALDFAEWPETIWSHLVTTRIHLSLQDTLNARPNLISRVSTGSSPNPSKP